MPNSTSLRAIKMTFRFFALVSLLFFAITSATLALPALPHLEAKDLTDVVGPSITAPLQHLPTLSTFSEISPVWNTGSPLPITSLAASAGFGFGYTTTTSTTSTNSAWQTTVTITLSQVFATSISLTTEMSTVFALPPPTGIPSTKSEVLVVPTNTTSGTVFTATETVFTTTSKAAVAPSLVAGLGSLLGVAMGVVAVL
jgi:hypothetical protein